MSNQLQKQNKPKFSVAIQTKGYQQLINNTLRDPKRANRFVASVMSAVAVNPALQECTPGSILSGALLGESLELSPSPQLGQFYLVPFKKRKNGKVVDVVATFILGYKGYIQLAIRSGQYKKLNVIAIKEGELIKFDPLTEEMEIKLIEDAFVREATPTAGYYAMFEYTNGFKKAIYWPYSKMLLHADRYSSAFKKDAYKLLQEGKIPQKDMWKYSSYWYSDFDGMGLKTMIRQLISKWGVMSIEMQEAFTKDDHIINEEGEIEFSEPEEQEVIQEKPEPEQKKKDKPKANKEPEQEAFDDEIPEVLTLGDL